ncbi:DUF551 domain-containing protein [Serratia marcescens]|uniref:DUF551 domain-containing protein n=1 Tax=Serratia marcescens TaxID=615 RepID=UPI00124A8A6B|nr:DUF551 domain-containing protein [Serratia marcescens]
MGWISVVEREPKATRQFELFIVSTDKGIGFSSYCNVKGFHGVTVNGNKQYSQLYITHWMPLPEAPVLNQS